MTPLKLEVVRDSKIGATLKYGGGGASMPMRLDMLESACNEAFGPDGIKAVSAAAGFDAWDRVNLQNAVPVAFALGFAAGSGRSLAKTSTGATDFDAASERILGYAKTLEFSNSILVSQGKAPVPMPKIPSLSSPANPNIKTFPDHVAAKVEAGMSKAAAISAVVKQFPAAHAEWLQSGDTSKL